MQELEQLYGHIPLLVFTDLKVVDANLNIINNSMWSFQKSNPQSAKNLYSLSISNPITGCTMMFNKKAKEISIPMAKESLMHDLWIALNVSHYGYIDFITEPTILYRQHNCNVIGARKVNILYYFSSLKKLPKVISNNIKLIQMIDSLSFRVNHTKRILLKILITTNKIFR
jgi:hypothetical protein